MRSVLVITASDGTVSAIGPFKHGDLADEIWAEVFEPKMEGCTAQVVSLEPWRSALTDFLADGRE